MSRDSIGRVRTAADELLVAAGATAFMLVFGSAMSLGLLMLAARRAVLWLSGIRRRDGSGESSLTW